MTMQILDCMGYTAKTLAGTDPVVPSSTALGLTPAAYINRLWLPGSTASNPRIDVALVKRTCNCPSLPWGVEAMFDIEWLVKRLFSTKANGSPQPAADRATWQAEIVKLVDAIRSTDKGSVAKIMPFHSLITTSIAANGGDWHPQYRLTNETVFLEPVPGAPNGIGLLWDRAVARFYREYRSNSVDAANIMATGVELARVYPGLTRVGLLQPRKSGADWAQEVPANRFDYLSEEQFTSSLEAAKASGVHWLGLWNSGHYGPEGWTIRKTSDGTFYAVAAVGSNQVVGDEWNENYGWAKALRKFQRGTPTVVTTPYSGSGGVDIGGGGVR